MEFLFKALQLIMSLSILVVLHELGHFVPAKLFKTKVEKFYLFFDPWFSLVKKKIGDTEYGIGWLPLGGYVKIAGMIDESMDKEQLKKPAQTWEFRAKPAWQRLIIMLGGVTVNLLLGIFIYAMTLYVYGDKYLPNQNLTDGVWCVAEIAEDLGFKTGDKFISADGEKIERFSDITERVIISKNITIERDGERKELLMPVDVVDKFISSKTKMMFFPRIPIVVSGFSENSNAEKAGLAIGDRILSINNSVPIYFDQLKVLLDENKSREVSVLIERDNIKKEFVVPITEDGKLGFAHANFSFNQLEKMGVYNMASHKYSLFSSLPAGYKKAKKKLGSYISQFKLFLNPSSGAYKGMGGFGAIGSLFPSSWSWEVFWNITAFLSLMLAFMNLLPIPALDGGHVMFLLYEIIVGRPAPEKIIESAQAIGMILLLILIIYANANDVFRLL